MGQDGGGGSFHDLGRWLGKSLAETPSGWTWGEQGLRASSEHSWTGCLGEGKGGREAPAFKFTLGNET